MDRRGQGTYQVRRRVLPRCDERGHHTGRDPGFGAGFALRTAGFDSARPTAWSAEGLPGYLPPEAQANLLDTITELSAPGSRVATQSKPNPQPGDEDMTKERLHRISERWRAHSFDPDMTRLRYFGERNEAAPYLSDRGWALNGITIRDLLAPTTLRPWRTTTCEWAT
jgi:methyltransferase (TIGR00027 family)